jgi:hypothetical protein
MSEAPTWKKLFDRLDATVGTRVNEFVRSEDFATIIALVRRGQREVGSRGEQTTRRILHSLNLPAGSDVNRLMAQIGNLEREVRELRKRLVDAETDRTAPRPDTSTPRPRPKGLTPRATTSRTRSGPRAAAS